MNYKIKFNKECQTNNFFATSAGCSYLFMSFGVGAVSANIGFYGDGT